MGNNTGETLDERFHTLIIRTFKQYADIVKFSQKTRLNIIELKNDDVVSLAVACDTENTPDSITVLSAGEQPYIQYEDLYLIHKDKLVVQRCRINTSGRQTIGFGTSVCISVVDVDQSAIETLENHLLHALPHPNPQVQL